MRKHSFIVIFLLTASLLALARTLSVSTDLKYKTYKSDVVVLATCMDSPRPGSFVFFNPVRDVWKDVKWKYEYVDDDFSTPTEEQITEYKKELISLQSKMEAVSNYYACDALRIELIRHQREYRIPFIVEEVFKGYVETNELFICYSSDNFSQTNSSFFIAGQKYFLFLEDQHAYQSTDLKGKYFYPLSEIWNPRFFQCTPASTNYVVYDKWEALADTKLVTFPSRSKTEEFEGERSLNHTQFVDRLKKIVDEQHIERNRNSQRAEE